MKTERGPSANRGRQYSQRPVLDLITALNKASLTLRMIQGAHRRSRPACTEMEELRGLDRQELQRRRIETSGMLSDLRAELRRRGHF